VKFGAARFARREAPQVPALTEGLDNGRVVERCRAVRAHDRTLLYIRGDEDGRHAQTKPVEAKTVVARRRWILRRRRVLGRHHVVVQAPVFVEGNHQQRTVPTLAVADRVVHLFDEVLTSQDARGY